MPDDPKDQGEKKDEPINFDGHFCGFRHLSTGGWRLSIDIPENAPMQTLALLTILENVRTYARFTVEKIANQLQPNKEKPQGRKAGEPIKANNTLH